MQQLSRLHGVTLVDLMITVSIVSILGIMSFSTLPDMLNRYRANTIVESYIRAVHAAREAAVSRQILTTVCPQGAATTCGKDWSQGVMVFTDANGNRILDAGDQVLHSLSPLPSTFRMAWQSWGNQPYIQFEPAGYTYSHNGTFLLCHMSLNPKLGRVLIMNKPGRIRKGVDSNGDGVPERADGSPLECKGW